MASHTVKKGQRQQRHQQQQQQKLHQSPQSRFDFVRKCFHDMDSSHNCPFCMLVTKSLDCYLKEEEETSNRSHDESKVNKLKKRNSLLLCWSKNQRSYYNDLLLGFTIEINLCKSLITALTEDSVDITDIPDIEELNRIIARKIRMERVGYYASIYLQARIRKLIAKRHVRRMLLNRFELVTSKNNSRSYYFDKNTGVTMNELPRLVRYERPASPATISRRLGNEQKLADLKLHKFKKAAMTKDTRLDSFQLEEKKIFVAKQLAIFEDIVSIAMQSLCTYTSKYSSDDSELRASTNLAPVSIAFTAPFQSARAFGIAEVLKTSNPAPSTEDTVSLNSRIAVFEINCHNMLRCDTPRDVVSKMLNRDIQLSMNAILNVAEDENNIWNGRSTMYNNATTAIILPGNILLQPFQSDSTPSSIFRLFYFEGELVAVSQSSPWVCYSEIADNRDIVNKIVKAFTGTYQMREYVRLLYTRAKEKTAKPYKEYAPRLIGDRLGGCLSLHVPPESFQFLNSIESDRFSQTATAIPTDADVIELNERYTFLHSMESFKSHLKKANRSVRKAAPQKAVDQHSGSDDVDNSNAEILARVRNIDLPDGSVSLSGQEIRWSSDTSSSKSHYAPNLLKHLNYVSTNYMERLTSTNDSSQSINLDLLVIDVAIDIAACKASGPTGDKGYTSVGIANGRLQPQGTNKSDTSSKASSKINYAKYCRINQFIGIYEGINEQTPSNLDLALFTWDHFRRFAVAAVKADAVGQTNFTDPSKLQPNARDKEWISADSQSGIVIHKIALSDGRGEFQLRIIGASPSKEYLDKVMPSKVKKWLHL